MGEGVNSPLLIRDYFNELFTYALSIGMPPELYWEANTELIINYVNAEKIRQEKANMQAWLNGLYVYVAIGNSFAKSPKPYLNRPIALTQEEIDRRNNETLLKLKEELLAEASLRKDGKRNGTRVR